MNLRQLLTLTSRRRSSTSWASQEANRDSTKSGLFRSSCQLCFSHSRIPVLHLEHFPCTSSQILIETPDGHPPPQRTGGAALQGNVFLSETTTSPIAVMMELTVVVKGQHSRLLLQVNSISKCQSLVIILDDFHQDILLLV